MKQLTGRKELRSRPCWVAQVDGQAPPATLPSPASPTPKARTTPAPLPPPAAHVSVPWFAV